MQPNNRRRKRLAYGLPHSMEAFARSAADVQVLMSGGINPDGSLKAQTIRALLKLKGYDLKPLAELHGFHDTYMHQVIDRQRHDERIEDLIAECLGLESNRIWGRTPLEQGA